MSAFGSSPATAGIEWLLSNTSATISDGKATLESADLRKECAAVAASPVAAIRAGRPVSMFADQTTVGLAFFLGLLASPTIPVPLPVDIKQARLQTVWSALGTCETAVRRGVGAGASPSASELEITDGDGVWPSLDPNDPALILLTSGKVILRKSNDVPEGFIVYSSYPEYNPPLGQIGR